MSNEDFDKMVIKLHPAVIMAIRAGLYTLAPTKETTQEKE